MVKFRVLIIIFAILLLAFFIYKFINRGEEKKVKEAFKFLSKYIEKSSEEDFLSSIKRVKNISLLFSDPCIFKIEDDSLYPFSGSYNRNEIEEYALKGRSYFSKLSIYFYDFKIGFPEKGVVHIRLTGRLIGKTTQGEVIDELREIFCILKKSVKSWLFSSFEVVEIIKK